MPTLDERRLDELALRLDGLRSRGQIKALGAEVDRDDDLRALLLRLAERRGVDVDATAGGKRLVRAVLDRADGAQVRSNPIRKDGGFTCAHCGVVVAPGGARVRDHCPVCLHGLHVDEVPGDRASTCGGLLAPVSFETRGRVGTIIHYRCQRCGEASRTRAHDDDRLPGLEDRPQQQADLPWERARTLPRRVLDAIRGQGLWRPGQVVLVAVSGGLDSTVLLELLWRLRDAHGGELHVASVDHGQRAESVAEVARVGHRATALGLPFHSLRLDVEPGGNLYARLRDARRGALVGVGSDRIATGHHQDDQASTVLYHLLRGSGGRGLRGMLPLAEPWCRPLLDEPRDVLRAWALSEGLSWIEDPSNPRSQRGELGRQIEALDAVHGGAARALARSARLLAVDEDLLHGLADESWRALHAGGGLHLEGLRAQHPALQLRLLQRLCEPCGARADQLLAALTWEPDDGAVLDLALGWRLARSGPLLRLMPPS